MSPSFLGPRKSRDNKQLRTKSIRIHYAFRKDIRFYKVAAVKRVRFSQVLVAKNVMFCQVAVLSLIALIS